MSTLSHEPVRADERRRVSVEAVVQELWAALAIVVMWLAVLFDAIFGPNIVNSSGGSTSSVPSAVVVAVFAFLGTWVVARYAFRRSD